MKKLDYIKEAHVTCSSSYHGNKIPLEHFAEVIGEAITALNKLDAIKKALFYGRDTGIAPPANPNEASLANAPVWIAEHESELPAAINIIHGVIGKATESGELLEALAETLISGKPFDKVNAVEEVGDGFWYDAILLNAIGSNFEIAQSVNIEKLRARFPNAFTEFDANNRNLVEERKILSNGVDTAE